VGRIGDTSGASIEREFYNAERKFSSLASPMRAA
jgi:hypothetical protein